MEVTKDNFLAAVEILKRSIDKADFVAIDGEFTGLSTIRNRFMNYDSLEEKYAQIKLGSSEFLLIQYGICLFSWNEENQNYEALPFTFYIFPRPFKKNHNDVMFMCQSSCLDFLAMNGFDFNKLFHKGISFMPPWEEEQARQHLARDFANYSVHDEVVMPAAATDTTEKKSNVFIPKDQREFIDVVCTTITDFFKDKSARSVDLPPCDPFQRKLIYETLQEKYPMGLYLESAVNSNNEKYVRAIKVDARKELKNLHNQKYQKELDVLNEVIGFTNVIKLITEAKKPIIGHNMFLDMFFTITNFFANPPDHLIEFKSLLTTLFPTMVDTKLMSNTRPLASKVQGTSLKKLMESIEDGLLPNHNVTYSSVLDGHSDAASEYHQAGYDAYCTGCSFISLSKSLLDGLKLPSSRIDISSDILMPFVNRIFMMRVKDIKYMDLCRNENVLEQKGIFCVKFPDGWHEQNLEDIFSSVCGVRKPVVWISKNSAYVTIDNIEKHDEVMQKLVFNKKDADSFIILPYADHAVTSTMLKRPAVEGINIPAKRKRKYSEVEEGELSSDENGNEKDLFEQPSEW